MLLCLTIACATALASPGPARGSRAPALDPVDPSGGGTHINSTTYAVPVLVSSDAPASFAVEQGAGNSAFTVTGYGLDTGTGSLACRIRPSSQEGGFNHVSGYPGDKRSDLVFPARVVNGSSGCSPSCFDYPVTRPCCLSTVECRPPPSVIVPGSVIICCQHVCLWLIL